MSSCSFSSSTVSIQAHFYRCKVSSVFHSTLMIQIRCICKFTNLYQYERDISSLKAIIKLASGVDLLMMWYNMVFALNQIYNIFNISMCTVPLPWLLSALSSQSEN